MHPAKASTILPFCANSLRHQRTFCRAWSALTAPRATLLISRARRPSRGGTLLAIPWAFNSSRVTMSWIMIIGCQARRTLRTAPPWLHVKWRPYNSRYNRDHSAPACLGRCEECNLEEMIAGAIPPFVTNIYSRPFVGEFILSFGGQAASFPLCFVSFYLTFASMSLDLSRLTQPEAAPIRNQGDCQQ